MPVIRLVGPFNLIILTTNLIDGGQVDEACAFWGLGGDRRVGGVEEVVTPLFVVDVCGDGIDEFEGA